jgi:hypothetical protein
MVVRHLGRQGVRDLGESVAGAKKALGVNVGLEGPSASDRKSLSVQRDDGKAQR